MRGWQWPGWALISLSPMIIVAFTAVFHDVISVLLGCVTVIVGMLLIFFQDSSLWEMVKARKKRQR